MGNEEKVTESESKGLASEMLGELREQLKRCYRIILILIAVAVGIIAGFLIYLYQYDFTSNIEQNGVYTLIDSEGNVISSDIAPEQIVEILEIINNGKYENDKKPD